MELAVEESTRVCRFIVELLSIHQADHAESMSLGRRVVDTGIRKVEVPEVRIDALGLVGDVIADKVNHGGLDQAVYVYSRKDADWWQAEYGYPVPNGGFGENLVFDSYDDATLRVGDRFTLGNVTLEATSPRIACAVVVRHVGDPDFLKRFRAAQRPGVYLRVLTYGTVVPGMSVEYEPASSDNPTLLDLVDGYFDPSRDRAFLDSVLSVPIAQRDRAMYQARLERLDA